MDRRKVCYLNVTQCATSFQIINLFFTTTHLQVVGGVHSPSCVFPIQPHPTGLTSATVASRRCNSWDVEASCLPCQQCEPIDPDPVIFIVLYDGPTHRALALPGAPVAQHVVHLHMSAIELKLFIQEYTCREAKLTYSAHAVTKDCGPPSLYHPGILSGLE